MQLRAASKTKHLLYDCVMLRDASLFDVMLLCYCVMFSNSQLMLSDHWMLIVAWKILLSHTLGTVCATDQE